MDFFTFQAFQKFTRNLRWAAKFELDKDKNINYAKKERFGFASQASPGLKPEAYHLIKPFEDEMASLISSINFNLNVSNSHQNKLRNHLKDIGSTKDVIVAADKSSNHYKMNPKDYDKFQYNHVKKDYKLAPEDAVKNTNLGDRDIAKELDIDDRVPLTVPRESFVTAKDHKDTFENRPQARLLNPCKPELGRVSKQLLEKIVADVKEKSGLLQFKNTLLP